MRDDGYFYAAFKVNHFQCRVFNDILEASLGCSLVEKNLVSVRDTRTKRTSFFRGSWYP